MKKILFLILCCFSIYGENTINISSIEDVLISETTAINSANNTDDLIEAYLSRGESYLLLGKFKEALKDYSSAFEKLRSDNKDLTTPFRNLFGLSICLFEEGFDDQGAYCFNEMQDILVKASCKDCHEHQPCPDQVKILSANIEASPSIYFGLNTNSSNYNLIKIKDQPILGPEEISINECVSRARGTANFARALISNSKTHVQFTLNILIDGLENEAIRCCRMGGLWKACLQPLVNKWHTWNEKWKVFGIPPDPAWD